MSSTWASEDLPYITLVQQGFLNPGHVFLWGNCKLEVEPTGVMIPLAKQDTFDHSVGKFYDFAP